MRAALQPYRFWERYLRFGGGDGRFDVTDGETMEEQSEFWPVTIEDKRNFVKYFAQKFLSDPFILSFLIFIFMRGSWLEGTDEKLNLG